MMKLVNGKTYTPFNLQNSLHREYLRARAWVKDNKGVEYLITRISDYVIYTSDSITPEILLRDFTFLDGDPCGVEKTNPEEHIRK